MPCISSSIRNGFLIVVLAHALPGAANASGLPNAALAPVNTDLVAGRADDAITRLRASLATNPQDAEAHNLLCRVYYQEKRWDDAIHECEIAVQLAPTESMYHLWLGRADGEKADSIHSIKAYGLAKKVKSEFERAVQLDPGNVDAISDLGDFYAAAPGIVGGGKDKAQRVVQSLQERAPVQAHQLEGRLAEKEKKLNVAESEFKAAVVTSKQSADAWMTLAAFYGRHQQWDQMLQALHAGIDADAHAPRPNGPALVDGAAILTRDNREPQLAIQLLERYLASDNQSAETPAFQVHAQLSSLLEQQGNHPAAQQHVEAAQALASAYRPASPRTAGQ